LNNRGYVWIGFKSSILKPLSGAFLAFFCFFGLGDGVPPLMQSTPTWAVSRVTQRYASRPRRLESLRQIALELASQDRARYGLAKLRADPLLSKAAQMHAEDMLRRHYFSHYSPEGKTASDRFATVGGRGGAAENLLVLQDSTLLRTGIDHGRLGFFERSWMNSPGHRQNLLDPRYGRFGFGVAMSGDRLYAVQLFSLPH
jgi:uncharacterized protein YkwD